MGHNFPGIEVYPPLVINPFRCQLSHMSYLESRECRARLRRARIVNYQILRYVKGFHVYLVGILFRYARESRVMTELRPLTPSLHYNTVPLRKRGALP